MSLKKSSKNIDKMLFATVRNSLESILKAEYKTPTDDGSEVVDYEMTTRIMKSRARVTLDFIDNVENNKKGGDVVGKK